MAKNCCKDCTDRHVGCHAECETYNAFVKEREEFRQMIYNERVKQDMLYRGVSVGESRRTKKKRY